jgi:hypothetical protein
MVVTIVTAVIIVAAAVVVAVEAAVAVMRLGVDLRPNCAQLPIEPLELATVEAATGVRAIERLQPVDLVLEPLLLARRQAAHAVDLAVELRDLGADLAWVGAVRGAGGRGDGSDRDKGEWGGNQKFRHGGTPSVVHILASLHEQDMDNRAGRVGLFW